MSTDWAKGTSQIATENDLKARWGCGKPGEYFRCGFCGYKFKAGDYFRWIYTNDTPGAGGNPFSCEECDTKDNATMKQKFKQMHEDVASKYWWFGRS